MVHVVLALLAVFPLGLTVQGDRCDLTVVMRTQDGVRMPGITFDLVRELDDGSTVRVGRYQTDADGRARISGIAQGRYTVVFAETTPDGRLITILQDWTLDDGRGGGFGIYLDQHEATILFALTDILDGQQVVPFFDLAVSEYDPPQPFDPITQGSHRHGAEPDGTVAQHAPPYKPLTLGVLGVCGVGLWLVGMVIAVGYVRTRAQRRRDEGRGEA